MMRFTRLPLLMALLLLIGFLWPLPLCAQTLYAVILGNQKYVVGSSTLQSGLFRSTDAGRSWQHLGPRNLKAFSMDAVDSSHGRILYIAAGNGIHRSRDSGKTWRIVTGWEITEVLDVRVDQHNPSRVYAATAWGMYYSLDGGDSWQLITSHPSRHNTERNPDRQGRFYCYRFVDGAQGALYLLTDSAVLRVSPPSPHNAPTLLYENQQDGARCVLITPTQEVILGNGVFSARNLDGAEIPDLSLHNQLAPIMKSAIYDAMVVRGDRIILGTNTGVWMLPLGAAGTQVGSVCVNISAGLPNPVAHAVAWLPVSKDLIVGTFGDGLYRRENGAWVRAGHDGAQVWRLVVKQGD